MHGGKRFATVVGVGSAAVLLSGLAWAAPKKNQGPTLTPQTSGTVNRLQAVSPVDSQVVWASGLGGTFARTTDGGNTWISQVVPGAETLQFRDVQGVSDRIAYLLSSGTGTDSRIYKTVDGGATWTLQFQNQDPNGFYDCFAFWSPTRGVTMGDSINGRFPVIRTLDGQTWTDIGDRLPAAQPSEGSFAASGTCVATVGKRFAWIGTGATANARILRTTDQGQTWAAYGTPITQGTPTAGVFSVDFRNPTHGVLGGGDFFAADVVDNFARSKDGGKTWELATNAPIPGAIFGLSYIGKPGGGDGEGGGGPHVHTVVATGPGGTAWTPDEGDTWFLLDDLANFWAVAFASPDAGWLVGTDGRIVKISF